MKIYDCFTFFNELDLLEIRLHTLDSVVDYFVLVEAGQTHQGWKKPLYFFENQERFKKFQHKIRHVLLEEFLPDSTAWDRENAQRNGIISGLWDASPDDLILISDADEIPEPKSIQFVATLKDDKVKLFEQGIHNFFLNYRCVNETWRNGTRAIHFQYMKSPQEMRNHPGETMISNAGWHFSYQGGLDAVLMKLESFAHQEYNLDHLKHRERLGRKIALGKDLFGRSQRYAPCALDESFPRWIQESSERYHHLLFRREEWPEVSRWQELSDRIVEGFWALCVKVRKRLRKILRLGTVSPLG